MFFSSCLNSECNVVDFVAQQRHTLGECCHQSVGTRCVVYVLIYDPRRLTGFRVSRGPDTVLRLINRIAAVYLRFPNYYLFDVDFSTVSCLSQDDIAHYIEYICK